MILISFYDNDVICDLMPVFTLKPDKVYVIYDIRRCRRNDIKNLTKAINKKLPESKVTPVECDSYSIKSTTAAFSKIIDENTGEKVYVDVTGGPELLTATGCSYARAKGGIPLYLDLERRLLYQVFDENESFKAARISLSDYLTAIGAKQFSNSHRVPVKEEFDRIMEMAEYIFDNLNAWSRFEKYMESVIGGEEIYEFIFDKREMMKTYSESNAEDMQKLLDKFCELGFVSSLSKIDYEISYKKYRQYLTTYGIWLEMYIYIKALHYYDEVYLGFIIDWGNDDTVNSNDNEIDVIVMDGSTPVFISCKTRKPEAKDVCEVGFLASRLGGKRARSVLATTYPVRDAGDANNSIYSRLKKFDVGLIETKDFKKKYADEVFEAAFRSGKREKNIEKGEKD